MKDQLLKAILHILSIVAKEEDVTEDERQSVHTFLLQNLRESDAERYLNFFDKTAARLEHNTIEQDKEEIRRLAQGLNKELTQLQKIVALVNLMELIAADGIITTKEDDLLYFTGECFKIEKQVVSLIKTFVVSTNRSKLNSEQVLIIDSEKNPQYSSSKHIYYSEIQGFIAILRISTYKAFFIKHIGKDAVYLNGVPLRESTTINFSSGSVVKTRSHTIYYSDIVRQFIDLTIRDEVFCTAKNLFYKFPSGKLGLRNICLQEESGKLIAIMGGSGAGKSTLLHVLNGNEKLTSGSVTINGVSVHSERNKTAGLIGFVPQEDLLIDDLTVFENLYYASKLCLGNLSNEEIKERVNRTLKSLGIYEVRDLKVGSVLNRVISGGQRKRINIGLELIREPTILFIDEPTSGLSSRDAEKIMELLKDLSLKGKLIFSVIHQPSSSIFKMFDRLLILDTGGYQIYYGNPVQAVVYFKEAIDRLDKDHGQCVECGNINAEQIFSIIETKIIDEYGRETEKRRILPPTWQDYFTKSKYGKVQFLEEHPPPPKKKLRIASRFNQMLIFMQRDFLAKVSNRQYVAINLIEPMILAAILAFIVRYSRIESYTFAENNNIPAYFFMSVIVALFMGMTISAEEIFKDKKILKRESFLNLSRSSYLISKLVILFSLSALQTLIFVLIGCFILEIHAMTLSYWMVLFSASCFANVLGLNISATFNSVVTIYIIVPLLLIPQIILSGVVVNFDELNERLASKKAVPWVGELMASRWAFEALTVTQFKDNPYISPIYKFDSQIAQAEYFVSHWSSTMQSYLEKSIGLKHIESEESTEELSKNLTIIRNEIRKQVKVYGEKSFPLGWQKITPDHFDESVKEECLQFVSTIKNIYINIHKKSNEEKEKLMLQRGRTAEEKIKLVELKKAYKNETLSKIVKNLISAHSISEENGELVQMVYPIYATPLPESIWEFRTRLFYSVKHFGGLYFSTLYFNIVIIWLMSFLFFLTLYFDILKKILKVLNYPFQKAN